MKKRQDLLESKDCVFSLEGEPVNVRIAYGQYEVLFIRHDINNKWNQRHINMVQNTALMNEFDYIAPPGELSVASHSLALFTKASEYEKLGDTGESNALDEDEFPFCAHISVTILKDAYDDFLKDEQKQDHFISHYQQVLGDVIRGAKNVDGFYKVYVSLHSGDLEVELKCRNVAMAYHLDVIIENSIYFKTHCVISSRIKYNVANDIIHFERLPVGCAVDDSRIVIGFTSEYDQLKELFSCAKTDCSSTALFGYYDGMLELDFVQFNCLYPILCENRLFRDNVFLLRGITKSENTVISNKEFYELAELNHRKSCPHSSTDNADDMCSACPVKTLIRELALGSRSSILSLIYRSTPNILLVALS